MFARNSLTVVLTLGGMAAAQFNLNASGISISQSCSNAVTQLVSDSGTATCLALVDVIPFFSLPSNTSLVPSINTWLGDMCAAAPCSNNTLDFMTTTVINGCQSDLATDFGATDIDVNVSDQMAEQYYPTGREVLCSKSSGSFCVVNTLTSIQAMVGQPLSIQTLMNTDWQTIAATMNTTALCTDCNQAAYATVKQAVPDLAGSDFETIIASKCGSSFVDSGVPSDVTVPTGAAAKSGAAGAHFSGAAVVGVLASAGVAAVSSIMMML